MTLLARMRANGLPRVAGDMRRLPFKGESFDWVLNFFTSFGYFERERENFRVLEEIVRVLVPEGRFLIDLMNPGVLRCTQHIRSEFYCVNIKNGSHC